MTKTMRKHMLMGSASAFIGLVSGVESAFANNNNNFNAIIGSMEDSISGIPGLISGIAYMMGILLGVLGILKIKDHVENPSQAKLQDGAVRLAAGGGLFALPIVYEAMRNTIGDETGATVDTPKVKGLSLDVAN